jgi:hypothetical protein
MVATGDGPGIVATGDGPGIVATGDGPGADAVADVVPSKLIRCCQSASVQPASRIKENRRGKKRISAGLVRKPTI